MNRPLLSVLRYRRASPGRSHRAERFQPCLQRRSRRKPLIQLAQGHDRIDTAVVRSGLQGRIVRLDIIVLAGEPQVSQEAGLQCDDDVLELLTGNLVALGISFAETAVVAVVLALHDGRTKSKRVLQGFCRSLGQGFLPLLSPLLDVTQKGACIVVGGDNCNCLSAWFCRAHIHHLACTHLSSRQRSRHTCCHASNGGHGFSLGHAEAGARKGQAGYEKAEKSQYSRRGWTAGSVVNPQVCMQQHQMSKTRTEKKQETKKPEHERQQINERRQTRR